MAVMKFPLKLHFVSRVCTAAICALTLSGGIEPTHVMAQGLDYRDPANVPPSWKQFAKLVQFRFETWVGADEEVANRFRSYLMKAGKDEGAPPTMVVRAWLNPDGTIEKVSFPALKDAQADADLRAILTRGNIGEAPPPEMLQPLSLRFSLNLRK
jgi:hypothetical protein